jgi:hypothetical protein
MPGWETFSVEKKDGNLIFEDYGGYENRNSSTFWSIKKADEIYKFKDFPKIEFYTGDSSHDEKKYTYSKEYSYTKLIPDFNFHGWSQVGIHDYEETVHQISESGDKPFIMNKVGWIGSIQTTKRREPLFQLGNEHPELFDIISMDWIRNQPAGQKMNATVYLSMQQLVEKYSILIDIEGGGYSARVKYLLWSKRPLLLVDRPHKEFFYEYLKEWEHYIPVKRDLSDLVEKTQWCLQNYEKACQIANNAYEFSKKYLTREACFEQWNKILTH